MNDETQRPGRQFRWWREGGFRWPWLARTTNGRWGLGRWTQPEIDRIKAKAAEWARLIDWDIPPASTEENEPVRAYKPEGYTKEDQRSDTAFLVGVRYGRASERARMLAEGYVIPPASTEEA